MLIQPDKIVPHPGWVCDYIPPVYIMTHGRSEFCKNNTLKWLRKNQFTGKIVFVLDDKDSDIEGYRKIGAADGNCEIEIFSKEDEAKDPDNDLFYPYTGELFPIVIYARQAAPKIAKRRGDRLFCMMDDDYYECNYRLRLEDRRIAKKVWRPAFDDLMKQTYELLERTKSSVVAWAQTGDGVGDHVDTRILRKCMNTFFFDTDRKFDFLGVINEDTNGYVVGGRAGMLILNIPFIQVQQVQTQSAKGGLSTFYLKFGTYFKSFTTIVCAPSACHLIRMGYKYSKSGGRRIHHGVEWEYCAPKILPHDWEERMKKKDYENNRKVKRGWGTLEKSNLKAFAE